MLLDVKVEVFSTDVTRFRLCPLLGNTLLVILIELNLDACYAREGGNVLARVSGFGKAAVGTAQFWRVRLYNMIATETVTVVAKSLLTRLNALGPEARSLFSVLRSGAVVIAIAAREPSYHHLGDCRPSVRGKCDFATVPCSSICVVDLGVIQEGGENRRGCISVAAHMYGLSFRWCSCQHEHWGNTLRTMLNTALRGLAAVDGH